MKRKKLFLAPLFYNIHNPSVSCPSSVQHSILLSRRRWKSKQVKPKEWRAPDSTRGSEESTSFRRVVVGSQHLISLLDSRFNPSIFAGWGLVDDRLRRNPRSPGPTTTTTITIIIKYLNIYSLSGRSVVVSSDGSGIQIFWSIWGTTVEYVTIC